MSTRLALRARRGLLFPAAALSGLGVLGGTGVDGNSCALGQSGRTIFEHSLEEGTADWRVGGGGFVAQATADAPLGDRVGVATGTGGGSTTLESPSLDADLDGQRISLSAMVCAASPAATGQPVVLRLTETSSSGETRFWGATGRLGQAFAPVSLLSAPIESGSTLKATVSNIGGGGAAFAVDAVELAEAPAGRSGGGRAKLVSSFERSGAAGWRPLGADLSGTDNEDVAHGTRALEVVGGGQRSWYGLLPPRPATTGRSQAAVRAFADVKAASPEAVGKSVDLVLASTHPKDPGRVWRATHRLTSDFSRLEVSAPRVAVSSTISVRILQPRASIRDGFVADLVAATVNWTSSRPPSEPATGRGEAPLFYGFVHVASAGSMGSTARARTRS